MAQGFLSRLGGEKEVVALSSVVAAVGLTALKLWVGLATNSLGILAEALHSGVDLIAAAITYFAVIIAARPPDETHPYGRAKFESMSALAETVLLFATSVWIAFEAIERLRGGGHHVEPTFAAFAVMVTAVLVDASRSAALYRTARKHHSQALEADALHFATDILSSTVVILGLVLASFGNQQADAYAALGVSIVVFFLGIRLAKRALDTLSDRAPADLVASLRRTTTTTNGVLHVPRLRARKAGKHVFVDMEVDVDRLLTFEEAHKVAHRVEGALKADLHREGLEGDVLVHLNPARREPEDLLMRLHVAAQRDVRIRGVHLVGVADISGVRHAVIELFVDPDRTVKEADDVAHDFERRLRRELPEVAKVTMRLATHDVTTLWGADVTGDHPDVTRAAEAAAREIRGIRGVRTVEVHRLEDAMAVHIQCELDPAERMSDAQFLTELLVERVRRRVPEADRVYVHVAPGGSTG